MRDFISCGVIICYMDDILIYTETLAEHRQVTWEVLAVTNRDTATGHVTGPYVYSSLFLIVSSLV